MSKIVDELNKTKSFSNRRLAKSIKEREESRTFRIPQDAKIMRKNEAKAYKLFLKLVTDEYRKKLVELDRIISSIEDTIYEESGWWMTGRYGFMYRDNFQNMHDPEFRTFDTYTIKRDKDGFGTRGGEPFNAYFASIQSTEQSFLERYSDKLELLHNALSEKEKIMNGNYELKDEDNRSLAEQITIFLGFKKEDKKVKIYN